MTKNRMVTSLIIVVAALAGYWIGPPVQQAIMDALGGDEVPAMVPLTPAEEACLPQTNAALERAGNMWADMLQQASTMNDPMAKQRMTDIANDLYNSQIDRIMRQHDLCVQSRSAIHGS